MEHNIKKITISKLYREYNSKKIDYEHWLQRNFNQWDKTMKSNLIDSILRGDPVDPIKIINSMCDENGNDLDIKPFVIDGKQRASVIASYIDNEFSLNRKIKDDPFVIDDVTYLPSEVLWANKFEKLPKELQDTIKEYNIEVVIIDHATDNDIRRMFDRTNSGKKLSTTQKETVHISAEILSECKQLENHEFWSKTALTNGNLKNNELRDMILQSMMLTMNFDYPSFKPLDYAPKFAKYLDENCNIQDEFNKFKLVLDQLNEIVAEKQKSLKKLNIPFIVYSLSKANNDNKDLEKYKDWLYSFFSNYENNEEYRIMLGNNTASKSKVNFRKEYFDNEIDKL